MARKYQSHSQLGRELHTSQNIKTTTRNRKSKKKKKEKVLSVGFVFTSLMIALLMFFAFFSIGVMIGPDLPI